MYGSVPRATATDKTYRIGTATTIGIAEGVATEERWADIGAGDGAADPSSRANSSSKPSQW